jgi:hypothetical protein
MFLVCCMLLATATLVFTASATPQDNVQSSDMQWEHLAITHQGAGLGGELSQQINRLGNEGWQLVCVSTVEKDGTTEKTVYYFKRAR